MDRFRIRERIGSGGMGTVYRAFDERLQRDVAVKEIADPDPQRVLREAQAGARLNHPGIVTLYELGERDGRALLVSELVEGMTLGRLRGSGALCDRDVAELASDLCEALAHAHARGVVHRDVKPENVIVAERAGSTRQAKLMDFGIARLAGAPTLTARGEVVGTLAYMSPEQAEGERAGPASDLYSLALTAYECWSGANPVAADNPVETARRIGDPVPALRTVRPDLPEGLTDTIDACLDPDPELRPDALELRDCLEAEIPHLGTERAVPTRAEPDAMPRPGHGLVRIAGALLAAGMLFLIAGPLGAGGLALVLAVLSAPSLVVGLRAASLLPPCAPLLGAIGLGGASAALGAAGGGPVARAVLGAGAWCWLLAGSLAVGAGPDLGIGTAPPSGWTSDPGAAADSILVALIMPASLLGATAFAVAGLTLGWLLGRAHASIALLGAMIWAAGVDLAVSMLGDGSLGGAALGVVAAAAIAVALEFGRRRAAAPVWRAPRAANGSRPLTT